MLLGDKDYINNVKALFKESFHGPDLEYMYTNQEIAPAKKAAGYWFDL